MMFRLVLCGLLAVCSSAVNSQDINSLGPPGSSLLFGDEFNAAALNPEMWGVGINDKNMQNTGVDCAYTNENLSFRDGFLVFTQRRESPPISGKTWTSEKTFNYSSGGIHTHGEFALKNNMYLELRCKLPSNNGGYGAFWTMSNKVGDWKPEDLLEIDMFEFIGNPEKTRFWSGLWWHDFRKNEVPSAVDVKHVKERSKDHFFVNEQRFKAHFGEGVKVDHSHIDFYSFITFGLQVTDNTMTWHLVQNGPAWKSDPYLVFKGGTVHNRTYGQVPDVQWKRDVPAKMNARIILNYALRNADWAGGPAVDSQMPSEMLVDYVRVYDTSANAINK
jgi:hypothetical protein